MILKWIWIVQNQILKWIQIYDIEKPIYIQI